MRLILQPALGGQGFRGELASYLETLTPHGGANLALAQGQAAALEDPQVFWRAARKSFPDPAERLSAYKLWMFAALSKDADQRQAVQFMSRLREAWSLPWLDGLYVTNAVLESGSHPKLDPRRLDTVDRQVTLGLVTILVHADQAMHALEIEVFKRIVELLGFELQSLQFLKPFVDARATDLAARLGPEKLAAALPFLLRTAAADGLPHIAERKLLESVLAACNPASDAVGLALYLLSLERGLEVELDRT
jgi:uncharacterized tellurite resistance protein B-like protein